jgi:hypothetical protein
MYFFSQRDTQYCSWLRQYLTSQNVAGSKSDGVIEFSSGLPDPSSRIGHLVLLNLWQK